MKTRNVCITLAVISAAACGGGGGSGSTTPPPPSGNTPPPTGSISVTNNAFTPGAKTVPAGTEVLWAWNSCTSTGDPYGGDQLCASHNVTFDDAAISPSPTQDQGTFRKTFTDAGTFAYHCTVHPMAGSITVQ